MEEEYIELKPNNFEDDCTGFIKTFIEDKEIDVFKKNDGKYEKYTGELLKQVGMTSYNFSPNLFVSEHDFETINNYYETCKQKVEEARRKREEAVEADKARLNKNKKWYEDQRISKAAEEAIQKAEEARQKAEEARRKNGWDRFKNFFKQNNKVAPSTEKTPSLGGRKKTRKFKKQRKQRKNKSRHVKR